MSTFQYPQKLVVLLIAICMTQPSFIQPKTVECINAYSPQSPPTESACNDKDNARWNCTTISCGRDGHQWVRMDGCTFRDIPGVSSQQCASYDLGGPGHYGCTNSGGNHYDCPYNSTNVPYITCTNCTVPIDSGIGGSNQGPISTP
ncbi:uncharacterized protein MELLADRAFT_86916 [Melampsora larici-populina 98AG31]|uniref:Secreted protein n=1 Tax=Melampsora larici-populina (strain 98AG31 / pathotype 3-4-7) TaxID=747676 RepID=F4R3U8_MELLP|nr:uncharacterized protein MELLADRAFT_86916 [Melampsora larici-populina 98AG31]EGG13102.1 secreted protein [Melampsora larici-populina 98AG31]